MKGTLLDRKGVKDDPEHLVETAEQIKNERKRKRLSVIIRTFLSWEKSFIYVTVPF